LGLTVHKLLERRLQSLISKNNFHAKTLHQARVIIKQGHIKIGKYLVNVPSFNVRVDSENSFNLAPLSPFDPANRKGRAGRRTEKKKKDKEAKA
jgi:small subunit ribosomal protein S9e